MCVPTRANLDNALSTRFQARKAVLTVAKKDRNDDPGAPCKPPQASPSMGVTIQRRGSELTGKESGRCWELAMPVRLEV